MRAAADKSCGSKKSYKARPKEKALSRTRALPCLPDSKHGTARPRACEAGKARASRPQDCEKFYRTLATRP